MFTQYIQNYFASSIHFDDIVPVWKIWVCTYHSYLHLASCISVKNEAHMEIPIVVKEGKKNITPMWCLFICDCNQVSTIDLFLNFVLFKLWKHAFRSFTCLLSHYPLTGFLFFCIDNLISPFQNFKKKYDTPDDRLDKWIF